MTDAARDAEFEQAKRAQAIAANPGASAYATANAGSGKTKVLIDRVARLLLRRADGRPGAEPDSILCITYTRAAASEMLTRLFETLGDWAVLEDEPLRRQLAELEGRHAASYDENQLKAARALFARALETPGGLRIETIHAFCARVLRRFPLEAGVVPGFTELEEDEARDIWNRAKQACVLRASQVDPDALALIAREAGRDGAISALDALKAGGAKLREFVSDAGGDLGEIEARLRTSIRPPAETPDALIARVMGPEFPEARIRSVLGPLAGGTANDLKLAAKLNAVLDCVDSEARFDLYMDVFLTEKGENRQANPYTKPTGKIAPALADMFETGTNPGSETLRMQTARDDLKRARLFARTAALFKVGLSALADYDAEKARRGALDFDDLIERTRDLLMAESLSSWALYKLDGQLSHLLLDEAQDTSPAQWNLIRALIHEFRTGLGVERLQDPRTVFMVGDEKQSIYSFQGADPARFLDETQDLSQNDPTVAQADMRMSFRSSPEILTFVDTVWNTAPVIDPPGGESRPLTADLIVHTARRWSEPGLVELMPVTAAETPPDVDGWQRPVDVLRQSSPKVVLAQSVAASVRRILSDREPVWAGGERRPAQPGDILILVRERRGGLFDAVIHALKSAGVPVAGADRLQLADYIGVQDCLNLMRFALLPDRDLTLAEILRGPFCGLLDDDKYLYELAAGRERGETLWSRVQASTDPDVVRARGFLEGLITRASQAPYEFLSAVLDVPDAGGQTGWHKLNARLGTPARDPVDALLSRALTHDARGPSSLQLFVAAMESTPVVIKRDLAKAGEEVRVMTVHGAKGLQAPIVILPDTTSKPKPGTADLLSVDGALLWSPRKETDIEASAEARGVLKAKALEEHRRLLYVALTRAQDRLLIGGYWSGGTRPADTGYDGESWYAMCLAAMAQLPHMQLADGSLRFGEAPVPLAATAGRGRASSGLPDWARRPPEADAAVRVVTAPTSLLGPRIRVTAPFDRKREARLRRGKLIHALLQHLPELPFAARRAAGAAYLAREPDLTKAQRSEMLSSAMGILEDAELSELFQPGGRAEAAIIGSSPRLPAHLVVNGRVDRLVITPDRVLVIDFKTDQPAPDRVEDVPPGYILQMAAYWAVLESAFRDRPATAVLCWTDGPRMMRIPETFLLDALKTAISPV